MSLNRQDYERRILAYKVAFRQVAKKLGDKHPVTVIRSRGVATTRSAGRAVRPCEGPPSSSDSSTDTSGRSFVGAT
jgi:hypothetical protein